MKKELEQKLQDEFSFMKRATTKGAEKSADNGHYTDYDLYGCEFSNGWYEVIRGLCLDITKAFDERGLQVDIKPHRINEKMGKLRLLCDFGNSGMHEVVSDIKDKWAKISLQVCEYCGADGELRANYPFVKTLCEPCYLPMLERLKQRNEILRNEALKQRTKQTPPHLS